MLNAASIHLGSKSTRNGKKFYPKGGQSNVTFHILSSACSWLQRKSASRPISVLVMPAAFVAMGGELSFAAGPIEVGVADEAALR